MTIRSWAALIVWWTIVAAPARAGNVDDASASFARGKQLLDRGDNAGAILQFEQAYRLDPRSDHLYNLAVAHHRNADRAEAIAYYRRYLDAAPTGKLAGNARRFLAELKAEAAADAERQARADADAARDEAAAARARADQAEAKNTAAHERAERAEATLRAAPLPAVAIAPPSPPRSDPGVLDDASADRGWLMPTALTAPAGTLVVSDFELVLVSASYAVTDHLTLGATAMLPVGGQRGAGATAKLQLVHRGRARIAAHTMLAHAWTSDASDSSEATTLGELGAAATVCIDAGCRSHVSGYLGAGLVHDADTSGVLIGGAAATFALGRTVRAVFELDRGTGDARGALGWYGLRFSSRSLGLDLGVAQPLGDAAAHLGRSVVPFIGFTYRSLGEP